MADMIKAPLSGAFFCMLSVECVIQTTEGRKDHEDINLKRLRYVFEILRFALNDR